MSAADLIKDKMAERGLSQADLVRMGIGSRSRVSELCTGKRRPSRDQALLLSKRLKLSLRALLEPVT